MSLKWFPWKWLVKRAARSHGVMDPFKLLARLRKFAEPSEVEAPVELIRAWTLFQARGIVNTRAIQHNLDWVWPYWVERQFNPRDPSFVPRSFSLAHINLTHRNWTAVSLPDAGCYALVDPRGLVTPLHDGWSLDAWIVGARQQLIPSRCKDAGQIMRCREELVVETELTRRFQRLKTRVEMVRGEAKTPELVIDVEVDADPSDMLCIALRPYNPEGIQFIDSVNLSERGHGWIVNNETQVCFNRKPDRYLASTYGKGDVFNRVDDDSVEQESKCPVGMATAAALFPCDSGGGSKLSVRVPLAEDTSSLSLGTSPARAETSWKLLDEVCPVLEIPDEQMTYLYHTAKQTLLSLSAEEVFPGSYTYRRFWFRDACLMLHALLTLNNPESCKRAFETSFQSRQTFLGFFESQQGEWDSNGQVLWLAERYLAMTGEQMPQRMIRMLRKGADWLCRKRLPDTPGRAQAGLLPPGFSAEHLGPNNYYYWDNFWGVAGLKAASRIFQESDSSYAEKLGRTADEYRDCILRSISAIPESQSRNAIPAAPGRRMDAGAVGSLVADYPLQFFEAGDPRVMRTVEFLLAKCTIDNGFFHDMTHSGINPYLTLHIAQVLLRAGDFRYIPLVSRVAELASPTGQWPEAIHPFTNGGCMGDGQHGWAAAEWVLMVRSLFVREDGARLVIGSGLFPEWLQPGKSLRFGPTLTKFGDVEVHVRTAQRKTSVTVKGDWRGQTPVVDVVLQGCPDPDVDIVAVTHGGDKQE